MRYKLLIALLLLFLSTTIVEVVSPHRPIVAMPVAEPSSLTQYADVRGHHELKSGPALTITAGGCDFSHMSMDDEHTSLPWLDDHKPRLWPAHAEPLPGPKPLVPGPDDWVIVGEEIHEDEVILLTGNLIVEPGGNLTLINCTLLVNCSYDCEWIIFVNSSGVMNVLEGSNITAYDPEYEFLFQVKGRLIMRDSFLSECGCGWDYPGLLLQTDEGVRLHNTTITSCFFGLCCNGSSNIIITECAISHNEICGIGCMYSSNITLTKCTISHHQEWGVGCGHSSNITITECTVSCNEEYPGIGFGYSSNILIDDCTIEQNYAGINSIDSSYLTITNCRIEQNTYKGIYCEHSSYVDITGCTICENAGGISFDSSWFINIVNCAISQNTGGVCCQSSGYATITNCTISYNEYSGVYCRCAYYTNITDNVFVHNGVFIEGSDLRKYTYYTIEDNTVNGKPLYYIVNITGPYTVPSDAGQIIIANSTGITIAGANLSYTDTGLEIAYSEDIRVEASVMGHNNLWGGIYCYGSSHVAITGCTIDEGKWHGLIFEYTSYFDVMDCMISHNNQSGILLCSTSFANITGCTIHKNNADGVLCSHSMNTTLHYCNIYGNNAHGLYVYGTYVVNATYCWWGSPDGPEYKAEGGPDDPEEVYSYNGPEYLIYEPWLTKLWDVRPPSVEIVEPEDGSYVRGVITIRAEASDNVAVESVEFYIDGSLVFTDYDAPYEYEWNTTEWADGQHAIRSMAKDLVGNTRDVEISVIVDNTGPVIESLSHSPEEPVEGQEVVVKAKISDAVGSVARTILWYRVDNGDWNSVEMSCSNGVWTATIPGQKAGSKVEYYIEAYDEVDNITKSDVKYYEVKAREAAMPMTWTTMAIVGGVVAAVALAAGIYLLRRRA